MTQERSSYPVGMFIDWLKQVMETNRVTRVQLGHHLGAGGKDKIDEDLSGSYLPSWGYVISTYLGPIEKITKTPLAPEVVAEGKQLYKTAAQVAKPSLPKEGVAESYSRIVAPVLAGLSLPAIVSLATATTPGRLSREISLSFLIMATGFFLASFQLTIGSVYTRGYNWGNLRAALSFLGIVFLIVALIVLVTAAGVHWWVIIAVIVLAFGGITQGLARGWLKSLAGPPGWSPHPRTPPTPGIHNLARLVPAFGPAHGASHAPATERHRPPR